eukprot:gene14026-5000_t
MGGLFLPQEQGSAVAMIEGFLGDQEAKFPAFNALPVTHVCVGMRLGSEKSYITLGHTSTSLLTHFQGPFHATIQESNWRNLLKGSQLQPYCNRQGFNNVITGSVDARVRIGILGNNENNCITPDSAIGIGIGGSHLQPTGVYTGATMSAQKNTFQYESSHWTSSSVYNNVYALTEGFLGDQEAKFPAFNALPVTHVCVGMRLGSEKSYITLGHTSTSLLTHFQGPFHATIQEESNWRNLLKGSQLQPYCNRQGFNNVIYRSVDAPSEDWNPWQQREQLHHP